MGKPFVDLMQSLFVDVHDKADYCLMTLCIGEHQPN